MLKRVLKQYDRDTFICEECGEFIVDDPECIVTVGHGEEVAICEACRDWLRDREVERNEEKGWP
jgi:hypothetical protein